MSSRPRRTGLSLIEILLLVFLVCFLSTTYFAFVRGNKDEVEDLYLRTQAMLAAQQVLEEARHQLRRTSLASFQPRHVQLEQMSGSLEVTPYPERPSMFLVKVTVLWGANHRLVLTQLMRDHAESRPPGGARGPP